MGLVESLFHDSVRLRLEKNYRVVAEAPVVHSQRERREYVAAMEDVLCLYAEHYDAECPVVCFDMTPEQLVADARTPWVGGLGVSDGRHPKLVLYLRPLGWMEAGGDDGAAHQGGHCPPYVVVGV